MKFELRDYQSNAVEELMDSYNKSKTACCISPTGSGKTQIIKTFVERILEATPDAKICLAVHRLEILNNLKDTLSGLPVEFNTIQYLNKHPEKHYDDLIVDECVDGDTEILTENGFVPFKEYDGIAPVAQWWEDGSIDFVKPERLVIKKAERVQKIKIGGMKERYMYMTDNHRQPIHHYNANSITVKLAKDLTIKSATIPTAGNIKDEGKKLSALDRIKVAIQADAYLRPKVDGSCYIRFAFTKRRKYDRIMQLLTQANIPFKEHTNVRGDLIITFTMEETLDYKHLDKVFKLSDFDYSSAHDFIDELQYWDCDQHGDGYSYNGVFEDNNRFVQAVSVLCGYTTNTFKIARKGKRSDINRTSIVERDTRSSSKLMTQGSVEWNDYMYCVTVPSSFFVVRSRGFTFVTGNCHHVVSAMYRKVIENNCDLVFGFTATPIRGYIQETADGIDVAPDTWKYEMTGLVNDKLFQNFVTTIETKELIRRGYLTDYRFVHDLNFHIQHHGSKNMDYTKSEIDDAITPQEAIDYVESTIENKKAIVFCHAIDFANKVTAGLGDKAVCITSKTSKSQRNQWFDEFRNGDINILVNVDIFSEGVDVPSVDCVYLFRPTRSIPVFFQQIGRALRPAPNKEYAVVYDYVNNLKRLGTEPKNVLLKDMLLDATFVKETCEVCGAYGVIEGAKDKLCSSTTTDKIREMSRWLDNNIDQYELEHDLRYNTVTFKLVDGATVKGQDVLTYLDDFHDKWFKNFTLPCILNQYHRYEIMNNRNAHLAISTKPCKTILLEGTCKYSDRTHPYYLIMDNIRERNTNRNAKIKF